MIMWWGRTVLVAAVVAGVAVLPAPVRGQAGTPGVGVHPGGGGAYVRAEGIELRILGYAQPMLSLFPRELDRPDTPAAFSVRRARVDFMALLGDDHVLFLELDGAPSARTALVEAWVDWALAGPALRLRAGKFIGHFSTENLRSSRSLLTVERYMALNSMFFLPGLDTQTGVALHGSGLAGGRLGYAVGVYNGNGTASTNRSEDNGTKEVQARIVWTPSPELSASLAADWTREEQQRLRLLDLAFSEYVGVAVEGRRMGVGGDFAWARGPWSLAGEGLAFRWETPEEGDVDLVGGYLQPAWFATGDGSHGLQLLVRAEVASLGGGPEEAADALTAITFGGNYHPTGNTRLQANAVLHRVNGPAPVQGFDDPRWIPVFLTQLQFKF